LENFCDIDITTNETNIRARISTETSTTSKNQEQSKGNFTRTSTAASIRRVLIRKPHRMNLSLKSTKPTYEQSRDSTAAILVFHFLPHREGLMSFRSLMD
jgi:hypothetical protein